MSLLDMDERILKIVELADLRATPITEFRYGSSPAASAMRPQRGSCDTSIIGA